MPTRGGPKSRPGTPGSGQGRHQGRMSIRAWHGPHRPSVRVGNRGSETASALLQHPFYHPMFEEGLKTALREICEAVGSPELKDMDFVAAPGA